MHMHAFRTFFHNCLYSHSLLSAGLVFADSCICDLNNMAPLLIHVVKFCVVSAGGNYHLPLLHFSVPKHRSSYQQFSQAYKLSLLHLSGSVAVVVNTVLATIASSRHFKFVIFFKFFMVIKLSVIQECRFCFIILYCIGVKNEHLCKLVT